jgi:glutamate 5-kinase
MKIRSEIKVKSKRIVIKLGSLAVTNETGSFRTDKITEYANDIARLKKIGFDVIVISSGAINSGKHFLKKSSDKLNSLSQMQASSAIGQPLLMHEFYKSFQKLELCTAQVLLTHDDIKDSTRYLNLKNTLDALLQNNIIPIVNENDSVSFEEISLGDNDQLAAMVSEVIDADALLLLTESDGLYSADPSQDKTAKQIPLITFKDDLKAIQLFKKTSVGKGGMQTKLEAVKKLTPLGIAVLIATYKIQNPIAGALLQSGGSFFEPKDLKFTPRRKSRIIARFRNHASVFIDKGAFDAIQSNASLLPVGVTKVRGPFRRGDVVAIKFDNSIVAYGICEYDSSDVVKIKGMKSASIVELIGPASSKVVIHKNNLILKDA